MSTTRSTDASGFSSPQLRLNVIGMVVISLFIALFARLWYLQIMASSEYKLAATQNQIKTIYEPAPRGRILDRDGVVLVDNRISYVVEIDPAKFNQLESVSKTKLLEDLSAFTGTPTKEISQRVENPQAGPFAPVVVAEDVSEDLAVQLRERQDELPTVVTRRVALRTYPHGRLASHVLGYVAEITQEELDRRGDPYRPGDLIGRSGVESTYESDLRGIPGERKIEVDRRGRPLRVISSQPPRQGNDLVLSIDADLQRVTEESLARAMESARHQRFEDDGKWLKANNGAAVVLDAEEGSVVAMASLPDYNPAEVVDGLTNQEYAALAPTGGDSAFLNHAIAGEYAPGSTWKLVTGLAALKTGLVAPNYVINDAGTYRITKCIEGCLKRNAGSTAYGSVDMRRAMAVSSDVFFYSLGDMFWQRRTEFGEHPMQDVAGELGFGETTGVQLPGEHDGRVLTPDELKELSTNEKTKKAFPNGDWYVGHNVNFAIGQGEISVTPMQLANAYATFVNGGTRYQPNIALRVVRQAREGEAPVLVRAIASRIRGNLTLAPEVRGPLLAGLRDVTRFDVTSSGHGTAAEVFNGFPLNQYPILGKTGTAQAKPKQDTALFVAAGSADNPKYVVSVIIDQGGFGATSAAPVARRVFGFLSGVEGGPPATPDVAGL